MLHIESAIDLLHWYEYKLKSAAHVQSEKWNTDKSQISVKISDLQEKRAPGSISIQEVQVGEDFETFILRFLF